MPEDVHSDPRALLDGGRLIRAALMLLTLVAIAVLVVQLRELLIVLLIGIHLAEGRRPVIGSIEQRGVHQSSRERLSMSRWRQWSPD